jgi:hypothetical protein
MAPASPTVEVAGDRQNGSPGTKDLPQNKCSQSRHHELQTVLVGADRLSVPRNSARVIDCMMLRNEPTEATRTVNPSVGAGFTTSGRRTLRAAPRWFEQQQKEGWPQNCWDTPPHRRTPVGMTGARHLAPLDLVVAPPCHHRSLDRRPAFFQHDATPQ